MHGEIESYWTKYYFMNRESQLIASIGKCAHKGTAANHLQFHKACARWIPRLLTKERKGMRLKSTFAFLQRYQKEQNLFWDTIVIGNDTWISQFLPEIKRSSLEWKHSTSPSSSKQVSNCSICRKGDDHAVFRQRECSAYTVHVEGFHNYSIVLL
ncbi:HTH_48 domain-containing protein [Nephila pilipes]|uniref:HTH_48 domain-containing protein n=1 Tax=Nephila pilipes TaxID=299642 RepID=A0A8X6TNS7_NEPPI|nr:HTH_48 domain-containing protein [Nephila pilipes]